MRRHEAPDDCGPPERAFNFNVCPFRCVEALARIGREEQGPVPPLRRLPRRFAQHLRRRGCSGSIRAPLPASQFFRRPDIMASNHSSIASSLNRSAAGNSRIDPSIAASSVRPSQAGSQRPLSNGGLQALSAARPPTQAPSSMQPRSAGSGLGGPGSGAPASLSPPPGTAVPAGTWAAGLGSGGGGTGAGAALGEAPSSRPSQGQAAPAGAWVGSLGSGGTAPGGASSSNGSASAGSSSDVVQASLEEPASEAPTTRTWAERSRRRFIRASEFSRASEAARYEEAQEFAATQFGSGVVNAKNRFARLAVESPDKSLGTLKEEWWPEKFWQDQEEDRISRLNKYWDEEDEKMRATYMSRPGRS